MKLSRGCRKYCGRGGGEYTPLRSTAGRDPRRPSSCLMICPSLTDSLRAGILRGSEGSFPSDGLTERPQEPNMAFALQLLLTFAKVAAVSESLSLSAYAHKLDFGLKPPSRGDSIELCVEGEGEGGADGDGGKRGEGGGSIEVRFVMPLHTVVANLDVRPDSGLSGVSVSLPSSCEAESDSSSSDSSGDVSGDDSWLVKPFHIVTLRRAPKLSLSF